MKLVDKWFAQSGPVFEVLNDDGSEPDGWYAEIRQIDGTDRWLYSDDCHGIQEWKAKDVRGSLVLRLANTDHHSELCSECGNYHNPYCGRCLCQGGNN